MGIDSIDVSTSETEYPDEYAGEYIDDNGMLVIQLAEYGESLEAKYYAMTGYSDVVRFEYVEYSYNELRQVYEEIMSLYNEYDIVKSCIDTYNNQIELFVSEDDYNDLLNDDYIKLNSNYLSVGIGTPAMATEELYGGAEITDPNGGSSIGFGGYYSGQDAILTCGHSKEVGDSVYRNGNKIGEITFVRANTDESSLSLNPGDTLGDFAIVELTGSNKSSCQIMGGNSIVQISGIRSNPPIGTTVYKYGAVTGLTYSEIVRKNVTQEFTVIDGLKRQDYYTSGLTECEMVSTNHCNPGDSGGSVFCFASSSNDYTLAVGIVTGKGNLDTNRYSLFYTPIQYAVNEGFDVKTVSDMK